jgi:SAM-dependent methyltransferase
MHTSLGYDSRIAERINVSRVPCGFHIRLLDPAISPVSCDSDPKPGLRESGLGCRVPQRAMMSAASEIPIRITRGYGLRLRRRFDKARALAPETRRLWQDLLSVHIDRAEMSLIIDLDCGTRRFSELLAVHFGVQVIGIDPSLKMLHEARRKPTIGKVVYCQGSVEALPFADGRADLVFMSMVYHHFAEPPAVARECHRVLRQGGYACVRNGTESRIFRIGISSHCGR